WEPSESERWLLNQTQKTKPPPDRSHAPAWECMPGCSAPPSELCTGGRFGRRSVQGAGSHAGAWEPSESERRLLNQTQKTKPRPDRSHAPAWECMPGCSASRSELCTGG